MEYLREVQQQFKEQQAKLLQRQVALFWFPRFALLAVPQKAD